MRKDPRPFVLNLLLLLNLAVGLNALCYSDANKGVKIFASDDEVLQPLFVSGKTVFEPRAEEIKDNQSRYSLSKRSRAKSSFRSNTGFKEFNDASLLKMSLDLPSFQPISHPSNTVSRSSSCSSENANTAKNSLKLFIDLPSIQASSARSSVRVTPGQQIFSKSEAKKPEVIIASIDNLKSQEAVPFDVPFSSVDPNDFEVIIYKPNMTKTAPGTIITGKPNTPAPGTVIATIKEKYVAPLKPLNFSINVFASLPFDISDDNDTASLFPTAPAVPNPINANENQLPSNSCNTTIVKKPSDVPTIYKPKRIKSLDENSINSLEFSPSYIGPKIDLTTVITSTFVSSVLIPYFKSGKILDRKSSYSLFYRAYQEFLEEDSLHDIELEDGQNLIIFGDIHGQFPDFIKVIEKEGLPSSKLKYIFNGDIVDRGAYSIECLMTLLAFKVAEPENFYITLGNHETASVGKLQFHKESVKKYGNEEFFILAHTLFKSFPPAFLVQNEVFITHGGITSDMTLERIRQIDRIDPDMDDEDYINDLIWSDPVDTNGTTTSHRGLGFLFGADATHEFIQQNNISVIIRSHQYKELGFSEQHDGLCITIFSCPNYRGKKPNYGAYIKLDSQLNLNYNTFMAAENNPKKIYPTIPAGIKMSRNVRRIR